ncbi:MAG: endonuclease/exonuclease/phosphatase family protein [Hyphomicrobiales bacterium]
MLRQPGALLCLVGLGAGLAALAAGRLAGVWIDLDVFNHFIPHLAVLVVACLLGLFVARASLATALAIMLIGLIGIGLWPHVASRQGAIPAVAEGERIVRVMTFNTRHESRNWRAVVDEVVRHDPDIVVLLEISRRKLPLFEALEADWPHRADCLDEDYCQNVILSKFAFSSSETRSQWQGPQMVKAVHGPELGGLTVVGAHTMRFPYSGRQLEQMQALGDELAALGGLRIVAGDLNAAPLSFMLRTLIERSGLELASRVPTWPATLGLPQIAIDHILVSPDLRRLGPARIGAAVGSDHYPVIAEIAVPVP